MLQSGPKWWTEQLTHISIPRTRPLETLLKTGGWTGHKWSDIFFDHGVCSTRRIALKQQAFICKMDTSTIKILHDVTKTHISVQRFRNIAVCLHHQLAGPRDLTPHLIVQITDFFCHARSCLKLIIQHGPRSRQEPCGTWKPACWGAQACTDTVYLQKWPPNVHLHCFCSVANCSLRDIYALAFLALTAICR